MLPTRRVNTYGRRSTAIVSSSRVYTPGREKEWTEPPASPLSESASSDRVISPLRTRATRQSTIAPKKSNPKSSSEPMKNKKENLVAELSVLSISSSPVKPRKRKPLLASSPKIRGSPKQRRANKRVQPLASVSNFIKSPTRAKRQPFRKPQPKLHRDLTIDISEDDVSSMPGGYPPMHPTKRLSPPNSHAHQTSARNPPSVIVLSDDSDPDIYSTRRPLYQPLTRQHAMIGSPPIRSRLSGGSTPSFHARLSGGSFPVAPVSPRPFSPNEDLPSPVDSDDEMAFLDAVAELEANPQSVLAPLPVPSRTESEPGPSKPVKTVLQPTTRPKPIKQQLSTSKLVNLEPLVASSSTRQPPLVSSKSMPLVPLKSRRSIMIVEIPISRNKKKPATPEKPVVTRPVEQKAEKLPNLFEPPLTLQGLNRTKRPKSKARHKPISTTSPSVQPEPKAPLGTSRPRSPTKPQTKTRPQPSRPKPKATTVSDSPVLQCLLSTCSQTEPIDLEAFVATFSTDEVHVLYPSSSRRRWRKIGEASYSEVFGLGGVVVKIVPLKMEGSVADMEGPCVTEMEDVEKEISVTRAMGEIQDGFIKLARAHVVRGSYPQELLELWDAYDREVGSESIRPDSFSSSQLYVLLILPDGGPDLEHYTFVPRTSWRTAFSIFWQVAQTLAQAESLVRFEHRDLHWGQILVQNLSKSKPKVKVTLIDLGLSRMDTHTSTPWYTELEPEVFEGKGDYQFDVYRMMKAHCLSRGDGWAEYKPLTNVMWLHYLARQLLTAKGLRKPDTITSRYHTAEDVQAESRACACLVETEKALGASAAKASGMSVVKVGEVVMSKNLKGSSGVGGQTLGTASAVVHWGVASRWIKDTNILD